MELAAATFVEMLLLPYVAWGVYNLRRKFRFRDDISPAVEACTLVAITVYLALEIEALEYALSDTPPYLIFAVLGLLVSATALYGHMAVSLLTYLLVDFFMPGPGSNIDHPRMGPEEELERRKDYLGALEGYLVLARIYPRDITICLRIANNLIRLGRASEAPAWLERALSFCADAEQGLPVVNRLCEVLEHELGRPEDARNALHLFLERFPNTSEAAEIREHIERVGRPREAAVHDSALAPLANAPIMEPGSGAGQEKEAPVSIGLARIEGPLGTQADSEPKPLPEVSTELAIDPIRPDPDARP